jgi:broad specificity phosphatase PhoE
MAPRATGRAGRPKGHGPGKSEIRITLVRHGQAGGPATIRELESPLTALGRKQARRLAERLSRERFDCIYSSDLSRAQQTAAAIREFHRGTPFFLDKALREVSVHHSRRGRTPPRTGLRERLRQEREAVERFCARLVRRRRPGQHVLIVAHGSIIGLLIALLAKVDPKRSIPLDMRNGSVSIVTWRQEGYDIWNSPIRVDLCNCVRHLLSGQVS